VLTITFTWPKYWVAPAVLPEGKGNYTIFRRMIIPFTTILWTEKNTKMFFIYSLQNVADCDKIWYILSWKRLSYGNV